MNLLNLSLIKIISGVVNCQLFLDSSISKPRASIKLIYKLNNNGCNSATFWYNETRKGKIKMLEKWRSLEIESRLSEALELEKQGSFSNASKELDEVIFQIERTIKDLSRNKRRLLAHLGRINKKIK